MAAESLHLLSQTMSLFGQTGQQLSSGQGRFSTGQTATQLQHTVPAHSLCIQSLHTVSARSPKRTRSASLLRLLGHCWPDDFLSPPLLIWPGGPRGCRWAASDHCQRVGRPKAGAQSRRAARHTLSWAACTPSNQVHTGGWPRRQWIQLELVSGAGQWWMVELSLQLSWATKC